MLSAAQMAQMSRLLETALELDPAGRRSWLEALAPEHQNLIPALRRALLPEGDGTSGSEELANLGANLGARIPGSLIGTGLQPGEVVGPYRLIRPLGTGGMAEVWLAQRADGALKRAVALKLPMLFRLRKDIASRFDRERDILAALVHPNIARLYDAGVSDDGLPYLVMEYVVGTPLTTYCDEQCLSIRARLELFRQVLSAVQYAHAHLVIHRDLKPANILVTEARQVQLLDFGIAKILSEGEAKETQLTQLSGRVLTPDYAAPEQIAGGAVTTAADVYALGVVLYELLTGEPPYRLTRETLGALEEAILQTAPLPPSRVAASETSAQARATTSGGLRKALQGDLDAITLKALKKPPGERYGSAGDFEEDVARFLRGDVVLAQPDRQSAAAGQNPASEKSIAVLPFVDMSQHKDQEYFADGLTEELIGLLTRVPELRVPARTSCFYFKGRQATITEIAQALNVAHALEGSVRKSGNTVRISVQLVRADTGYHLWSQTYDRTLVDIFKVQDEIAAQVVQSLSATLLSGTPPGRTAALDSDAYQLYLRGHFHWNRRSPEEFRKAISFFEQAIALDPDYALAFTGLADCYSLLPIYDRTSKATETMPQAKTAILRALAIDDRLSQAHASLGLILGIFDFDWTGAERQYQRAIELSPNSPVPHQWYGELLVNSGSFDEGLAEGRRAVELDPLSQVANLALGIQLNSARRYDEAIEQLQKTLTLERNFADTHYFLFEAYANKGMYPEAVAAYARQKQLDGESAAEVGAFQDAFARDSWPGFLQARIRSLEAQGQAGQAVADELVSLYARLGDLDRAFAWLEQSYAHRSARLTHLRVDARYDNLRDDARFEDLLHRVGLGS